MTTNLASYKLEDHHQWFVPIVFVFQEILEFSMLLFVTFSTELSKLNSDASL